MYHVAPLTHNPGTTLISLNNVRVMQAEHILLEDSSLSIHKGQKVGIIGRNGSGKTSLFAVLNGELGLDQGELKMPAGLRIAQMHQETLGSDRSARDHVIDGDHRYRQLEQQLQQAEAQDNTDALVRLHSELDRLGVYDIEARAEQLLSGLGFHAVDFPRPISDFSGGWRIRLNLAQALMAPSDLLLLDEPTNHLDLEATLWLEQWLNRYEGTLLIISHDRSFLDKVIDHVVSFENRQLILYKGNYSAYEKQRAERLALQQAMAEKQQRRVSEIEDFVRRFRYKATKAKQAQSRLKELDRMQRIAPAHIDSPLDFRFPEADRVPDEVLSLEDAAIGIDQTRLVEGIRLRLLGDTRIGLLGLNGSGKSTLLKTLAGELPLLDGEMNASRHLKIGYFAQHQVDVLNIHISPLQTLQKIDPAAREQELRNFLGSFDFRGNRVDDAIENFSGGEKSRLALALIAWQKPNLLLMDEPTNHLDMDMRWALTEALLSYRGALVIVSHDRHLLNNTVDEYHVIRNGRCRLFDGTLDDYAGWLQEQQAKEQQAQEEKDTGSGPDKVDKKALRQEAAARRQALVPLRKEVQKLEKRMDKLNLTLSGIEEELADPSLYEDAQKPRLSELLKQQGELRGELEQLEEDWLEKSDLL